MKITFVANFMNHHQLPFSEKMLELTQGEYCFIAHSPIYAEQVALGYEDMNMLPFVIRSYESEELHNLAMEKIQGDDMVIFGGCPNEWIKLRSNTGKPFLIYSERFFKKGTWRRFIPITYKKIYDRMLKYKNSNMVVICSSAFLPYDLQLLHSPIRTIKWGYFPPVEYFESVDHVINSKKHHSIVWVGRFLKLKHPETAISLAEKLKRAGYDFELKMIGRGPLLEKITGMVKKLDLQDNVKIIGAVPATQVRNYMREAEIMISTSDVHEGWGAVVNEAMNSACAVVASHLMGSVPFLINNGVNGFAYDFSNENDLYDKVKLLMDDKEYRIYMSKQAYYTISDVWNSDNAAVRLFSVISDMVKRNQLNLYEDGPCSFAEVVKPKNSLKG